MLLISVVSLLVYVNDLLGKRRGGEEVGLDDVLVKINASVVSRFIYIIFFVLPLCVFQPGTKDYGWLKYVLASFFLFV